MSIVILENMVQVLYGINSSAKEIDSMANAMEASTEEVYAVAQTLSFMTKDMMEQVNKFKL